MNPPKKNWRVRPLTDQARGALFNILANLVPDTNFLDLFAGTGAVGIEALSRGAKRAIFVELNRLVVSLIRDNLAATGFSDRAEVYACDVGRALKLLNGKGAKFDLVFMGAPYDDPALEKAIKQLADSELLNDNAVVIAEHRRQHKLADQHEKLKLVREERYGETVLAFYKVHD